MSGLKKKEAIMSKGEVLLELQISQTLVKYHDIKTQYRFAALHTGGIGKGVRARLEEAGLKDWRFDIAFPLAKLAIEVEGVTSWGRNANGSMRLGRHQTAKGMEGDLRKYDAAARLGWVVYRCSQHMVEDGTALETITILLDRMHPLGKGSKININYLL